VLGERVLVIKDLRLVCAELLGDRVTSDAGDFRGRVRNDFTALNIETLDIMEGTTLFDELGDDSEDLVGVDGLAGAEEGGVAHSVGVEVASVGIAAAGISVGRGATTAGISLAHVVGVVGAGMRSVGGGHRVGLPNVHLGTACSMLSIATVLGGSFPSLGVSLSIDELDISGALRVTITSSIFGTSLVGGELARTSISIHGHKVESTVHTTGKLGDIHIKCELLTEQFEHLVVGLVGHQVETGADVLLLTLGDKAEMKRVATGGDAIGRLVLGTIEGTVLGTGHIVGAGAGVPLIAGVAVLAIFVVDPSPIGIDDDLAVHVGARASLGALLKGQFGMVLWRQGASQLTHRHWRDQQQKSQ